MNEIKKISVVVIQDSVVFKGAYYEKGKTIPEFPYVEGSHKTLVKPAIIEKEEIKEEVKEEIKEEPKEKEPVRKGRK